jgi:SAM-dependent methyltransferase
VTPLAVARLAAEFGLGVGKTIVDLGAADTERAARLSAGGARVIAIEPSEERRAGLARAVVTVEIVDGAPGDIPLPEWTADVIVTAAPEVWLVNAAAVTDVRRVLRPEGGLAVIAASTEPWAARLADQFTEVETDGSVHWCRKR